MQKRTILAGLLLGGGLLLGALTGCHSSRKTAGKAVPDGVGGQVPPKAAAEDENAAREAASGKLLETLLQQYPQYFSRVLASPDSFRVQIIYTRIDRDADNKPSFRNYYYHVDKDHYFYPASTVKLPVAALALQKLQELKLPDLDRNSSLVTEQGYSGETPVYNDPSSPDGRPTVAQYIRKILLVSDNDAFNRLYEFVGQEAINSRLHQMGYKDAEILHRLDIFLTEAENRHTNPVNFYDTSGRVLYSQPLQASDWKYAVRHDSVGAAFYRHDSLIRQPMSFSKKNRIGLEDLHTILRSLLFPQSVPSGQRFHLAPEDYSFLLQYLSEFPSESAFPAYDPSEYPDAYGKQLYWGREPGKRDGNKIRIFSKEGDAYGFLTDVSYFADLEKGVEYMLSATIYCDTTGIANGDSYDYEGIGLPFMKNLGQVIYAQELQRSRAHRPDLSGFRLRYQ